MFKFGKYFIRQPSLTFSGLDETSAYAGHGLGVADDLLGCACRLGFAVHGKHQWMPGLLHTLHDVVSEGMS